MKPDEQAFREAMLDATGRRPYQSVCRSGRDAYEIAESLGIPPKRARYLLWKWADYDYGTSEASGWFTPPEKGPQ